MTFAEGMGALMAILVTIGGGIAWFLNYIGPFLTRVLDYSDRMVQAMESMQLQFESFSKQSQGDKDRRESRYQTQMNAFGEIIKISTDTHKGVNDILGIISTRQRERRKEGIKEGAEKEKEVNG